MGQFGMFGRVPFTIGIIWIIQLSYTCIHFDFQYILQTNVWWLWWEINKKVRQPLEITWINSSVLWAASILSIPGSTDIYSHHQLPVQWQQFISQFDASTAGCWAPLPHLCHPDASHIHDRALFPPPPGAPLLSSVWVPKNRYVPETEAKLAILLIFTEGNCMNLDV